MKSKYILLLLAAGTLSLAGCQKTGLFSTGGGEIRFSATASPAGTKTVYGTAVNGDDGLPTWQSIDWVAGDKIRIYSDAAVRRVGYESGASDLYYWSDYQVTGTPTQGTSKNALSQATLANLIDDGNGLGNGLIWGDAASANFFAIYPAPANAGTPGAEATGKGINGAKGILSGSIPTGQALQNGQPNMSYAYMTAAGTGAKPATDNVSNVQLTFYPAFTAFEITLKSLNEHKITGAQLRSSSTALAGDFTVTYEPAETQGAFKKTYGCPKYAAGTNNVVSTSFPNGVTVNSTTSTTFTLFALPQDLTNLTLGINIQDTEGSTPVTRTLGLIKNNEYITFAACKKHRIYGLEMPDGTWKLYLETEVAKWEKDAHTPVYGNANADGVVINASALEFASGVGSRKDRILVTLKNPAEPLVAYFGLFAPTGDNCKWRITMKGENASHFTLSSTMADEGHASASEKGGYIEGSVSQRVLFTLTPNAAATPGEGDDSGAESNAAVSGDSVELYFTVVVTVNGVTKEYSLHSEVTRDTRPLTVKMP